ncbi:MAG: TrkH family potassium uptake protein, partial [Candidatus Eisenbacteria bacterium]|nr:TrkH family potassium uptake protein [Candidatus Eisenbacteria bacterium]
MKIRAVIRVMGFIAVAVGIALLAPIGLAFYQNSPDLKSLLFSSAIPLLLGLAALVTTRGGRVDLGTKDGFAIVTFGWLAAALFGALPYFLSGAIEDPASAFFESMSGFTTTGSTILTDIEAMPPSLLLWRSLTQWIGGMGIVVLSVAVLPMLGIGGMQLYRAEMPGPTNDRLTPRIQSAAKTLWGIYLGLTVLCAGLLFACGMSVFDAINHAFCTIATAGFSTKNGSIGSFNSVYIEGVVIFFMLVSATNFSLHMWIFRRRAPRYFKNEEFRLLCVITLLAVTFIAALLYFRDDYAIGQSVRQSLFQVVSILTTTGFGTADYLSWGFGTHIVLFSL